MRTVLAAKQNRIGSSSYIHKQLIRKQYTHNTHTHCQHIAHIAIRACSCNCFEYIGIACNAFIQLETVRLVQTVQTVQQFLYASEIR